ncbi:MAG: alpha/beta hydrolase [Halioglobus sp.]
MTLIAPRECVWQIDGLQIAGLAWGNPEMPPMLALHGWLDNAASFNELAPLLESYHVVALDLTGHGRSSHRSADASYQIWDDLPQILAVVDQLGWDSFALMGHSRGATIASLLSCARPERVSHVVLLDALMPQAVPEEVFASQLGRFLDQRIEMLGRTNKLLESIDQGVSMRIGKGLGRAGAEHIAPRSLQSVEGGYQWTNDFRLRGASAVKLSSAQVSAALQGIKAPVLLLLGEEGHGQYDLMAEQAERDIANVRVATVGGKHHFHLEGDVLATARYIQEFLTQEKLL